jgi:hypothetical protein
MEKRAVAPLVLGGAGLALAIAIAVLVVKVRAAAPAASATPPRPEPHTGAAPTPPPPVQARPERSPRLQAPEPEAEGSEEPATVAQNMTEANRLYDRGDYEAAGQMAKDVLKAQPQNVKMLRIAASTACILGDASEARAHYEKLPPGDQEQIARRCRRYGVEF